MNMEITNITQATLLQMLFINSSKQHFHRFITLKDGLIAEIKSNDQEVINYRSHKINNIELLKASLNMGLYQYDKIVD